LTKSLTLAAAGAVLGTLAETVHHRAGVWTLPDGGALPAWIALAYFAGLLAAFEGLRRFERRQARALVPAPRAVALEALLFVALFLAPPLLHPHERLLTALAIAYLAARLVWFRAPGDVAVALAVAAADAALERALIGGGLFRYAHASLGPLPLWLVPLWAGLGLGLRRLALAATARA
jgi:hypothetical protein